MLGHGKAPGWFCCQQHLVIYLGIWTWFGCKSRLICNFVKRKKINLPGPVSVSTSVRVEENGTRCSNLVIVNSFGLIGKNLILLQLYFKCYESQRALFFTWIYCTIMQKWSAAVRDCLKCTACFGCGEMLNTRLGENISVNLCLRLKKKKWSP